MVFDGPPSSRSILRQTDLCRSSLALSTPNSIWRSNVSAVRNSTFSAWAFSSAVCVRIIIVHQPHFTLGQLCPASPSVALECGISDMSLAALAGLSEPWTFNP